MISEEQAMTAVARLREYEACDEGFPYCSQDELYEDLWIVAWWQFQELARRDAERKELDQPIDAEWLESMGFRAGHDLAWHSGRVSVRQYAQSVHDNTTSTILLDDNEIIWNTTRRQLLRLIEALRGGA